MALRSGPGGASSGPLFDLADASSGHTTGLLVLSNLQRGQSPAAKQLHAVDQTGSAQWAALGSSLPAATAPPPPLRQQQQHRQPRRPQHPSQQQEQQHAADRLNFQLQSIELPPTSLRDSVLGLEAAAAEAEGPVAPGAAAAAGAAAPPSQASFARRVGGLALRVGDLLQPQGEVADCDSTWGARVVNVLTSLPFLAVGWHMHRWVGAGGCRWVLVGARQGFLHACPRQHPCPAVPPKASCKARRPASNGQLSCPPTHPPKTTPSPPRPAPPRRQRLTPEGRHHAASMIAVGAAATLYHASSGRARRLARKVDYWTIAYSSTAMVGAGGSNAGCWLGCCVPAVAFRTVLLYCCCTASTLLMPGPNQARLAQPAPLEAPAQAPICCAHSPCPPHPSPIPIPPLPLTAADQVSVCGQPRRPPRRQPVPAGGALPTLCRQHGPRAGHAGRVCAAGNPAQGARAHCVRCNMVRCAACGAVQNDLRSALLSALWCCARKPSTAVACGAALNTPPLPLPLPLGPPQAVRRDLRRHYTAAALGVTAFFSEDLLADTPYNGFVHAGGRAGGRAGGLMAVGWVGDFHLQWCGVVCCAGSYNYSWWQVRADQLLFRR